MAEVHKELIEYLSDLSRIACTEDEKLSRMNDLKQILGYIDQLNEVNTDGVEPCKYVTAYVKEMPLRKDIPNNTLPQKKFLDNAPQHTAQMVRVPQVLKKET